jgi:hypothetical protein
MQSRLVKLRRNNFRRRGEQDYRTVAISVNAQKKLAAIWRVFFSRPVFG